METIYLVTLILFSENHQLTNEHDDRDLAELVFIPYDEQCSKCDSYELYEMIG